MLFENLKKQYQKKEIKVDFKTIVDLIGNYVKELNSVIYQIKTDELVSEVVDKLDLFSSIGEIKDKNKAKNQVINLAAYLLFNQILFYHIYKRKTSNQTLVDLEEIKSIKDLQSYFDKITDIDYQSIYRINILGRIPDKKEVIDILNETIKSIKLLRAEHITHDLAGRFFHDLLPFEVRKVLAAFYTHPNAADILTNLTIDSWDEKIIDPACGSGTLLVSSYRRKEELYKSIFGYKDRKKMHKQFIEEDLTGIDIMPFAAHITTINLTTQNIEQETNIVRIGTRDSLELAEPMYKFGEKGKQKGLKISPYTETIQQTLSGITQQRSAKGAVSPEGKGGEFYLNTVDAVIMNPPFTDREKMPAFMRNKINANKLLINICGKQIDFWGYFLALADFLLNKNGKIGAVIPINFARGRATQQIRDFILENYHIKYIIKPVGDIAFSEGAMFRDILLVCQKKGFGQNDITKIVFLKSSIKKINSDEVRDILEEIKSIELLVNEHFSSNRFDLWNVKSEALLSNRDNLMLFLSGSNIKTRKLFIDFLEEIESKGKDKIRKLTENEMRDGFHASPKGLSELTFITNPFSKNRTKMNVIMLLDKENKNGIQVRINSTGDRFTLSNDLIVPGLKTLTSIPRIDITKTLDYIVHDSFPEFKKVKALSKWVGPFNWKIVNDKLRNKSTYFALQCRIRINSPNTNFIGVFCNKKFYTTHSFTIFNSLNKLESKILALFMNSTIGLSQISVYSKETTAGYIGFRQTDLIKVNVLNIKNLSKAELDDLVNLFNKIKKEEFPCILDQIKNRFWARVEIDKLILKIIGFSKSEINDWLPRLYDSLLEDLTSMEEVK
ncbi:MAG: N-6 DNA methylase [Candidatus Heimdallarchaeota archaeon]|nr:N-6 DNA methylase [Candidatus Heimdallarchaeota archaeon]